MSSRTIRFVRQQRLLDALDRSMERDIVREKNRYIAAQIPFIIVNNTMDDTETFTHKANMEAIFRKHGKRIIKAFSIETEKHIQKSHPFVWERKQEAWEYFFSLWITERGAEAARQTSETTRSDIQTVLLAAQQSEDAIPRAKLVENLLKVKGYSRFRAQTIARTETHNAAMFSSKNTAQQISADVGITLLKEWNSAEDHRTRPAHAAADGKKVPMDGKFYVWGEPMDRPGDPSASARNVIRCRCVLTYEPA